jgi:branched-chain amino acid transport system permease protein
MAYLAHLANVLAVYAILAMSLNLLLGYSGLVSLAHGAFFGLGAYAFALVIIHSGVDFFIAVAAAVFITGLIATIIAIAALRTRADYLVLITLGLQVIIFSLLQIERGLTRGLAGLAGISRPSIFGIELRSPFDYLPLMLAAAVICFVLLMHITTSPFGRLLKSMREDEDLVRSLGKNVTWLKIASFMLAGSFAAVGGALFATYTTFLTPLYFRVDTSILLIAMVALGGMGNLWGSVAGAAAVTLIPEGITFLARGNYELVGPVEGIVWGLLLIIFMRFRPQGFVPERWTWRRPRVKGWFTKGPAEQSAVALPATNHPPSARDRASSESGGEDVPRGKRASSQEPAGNGEPALEVRGLGKSFGGLRAVDKLDLKLTERRITALIGSNGAGKTTTYNLITGFTEPDAGRIFHQGTDITALSAHRIVRRGVVRSWQGARVFGGLTVIDNVLVARPTRIRERLSRVLLTPLAVAREERSNYPVARGCLEFVGLDDKADVLARELSFAEQKMLQIACLLATEAEILLLDEPVSGVDPNWIAKVSELLRSLATQGRTLCIIEHNLDVVRSLADVAFFLDQGRVVKVDTPEGLMKDEELVALYFGT